MIYPIVAYGDAVLRKVAQPIDKTDPNLPSIIANMFETMYASSGIGLAAPQVGQSIRLFVVDGTPINENTDNSEDFEIEPTLIDFKKVFINPKVLLEEGDEWAFEEGCLSIPGIRADVYRHEYVKIQYFDENWTEHTDTFEGMAARIIQHEYDHLEGKLFTDHLPLLKRQILKKKLSDISKGKVQVDYRMRFVK